VLWLVDESLVMKKLERISSVVMINDNVSFLLAFLMQFRECL